MNEHKSLNEKIYFSYADAEDPAIKRIKKDSSVGKRLKVKLMEYMLFYDHVYALDSSLGNNRGMRWLLFDAEPNFSIDALFEMGILVPVMRYDTFTELREIYLDPKIRDWSIQYWMDKKHASKLDCLTSNRMLWYPETVKNSYSDSFKRSFIEFEPRYNMPPISQKAKQKCLDAVNKQIETRGFLNRGFLKLYFEQNPVRGYNEVLKQLRDQLYHLNMCKHLDMTCALEIDSVKAGFLVEALEGNICGANHNKVTPKSAEKGLKEFKTCLLSSKFLEKVSCKELAIAKENTANEYDNYKREMRKFQNEKRSKIVPATIDYLKALEEEVLSSAKLPKRYIEMREKITSWEIHKNLGNWTSISVALALPFLVEYSWQFIIMELIYIITKEFCDSHDERITKRYRKEILSLEAKMKPRDPSNAILNTSSCNSL
jgi:hypothetical protein